MNGTNSTSQGGGLKLFVWPDFDSHYEGTGLAIVLAVSLEDAKEQLKGKMRETLHEEDICEEEDWGKVSTFSLEEGAVFLRSFWEGVLFDQGKIK